MLVTLREVYRAPYFQGGSETEYDLREIDINSEDVTRMWEDVHTKFILAEGRLPKGLSPELKFTRIFLSEGGRTSEIVVVGSLEEIRAKLKNVVNKGRRILNG